MATPTLILPLGAEASSSFIRRARPVSAEPRSFRLEQFPEKIAVVQLGPGAEVPEWAESSSIFSITATAHETSLICAGRSVPKKARHEKPFTAFCVDGQLDLGEDVVVTRRRVLARREPVCGEIDAADVGESPVDDDQLAVQAAPQAGEQQAQAAER